MISSLDKGFEPTNYILFDKQHNYHYLFVIKDSSLIPIGIPVRDFNQKSFEDQVNRREENAIKIETEGRGKQDFLESAVDIEIAVADFARKSGILPENQVVRRISPVSNDFYCQRHAIFEREGQMFGALRRMGAWSLGELQELHRVLFSRGIYFDSQSGKAVIDEDLSLLWLKIRAVSRSDESESGKSQVESEMRQYAREKLYFEMAINYFKENPRIIDLFLKSPEYRQFAMDFKDRNLSSLGLTERGVAENMLANYYLLMLEGGNLDKSFSQLFLANIPGFHKAIESFVNQHQDLALPTPEIKNSEQGQTNELSRIFHLLKNDDYSFAKPRLDFAKKSRFIKKRKSVFHLFKIR